MDHQEPFKESDYIPKYTEADDEYPIVSLVDEKTAPIYDNESQYKVSEYYEHNNNDDDISTSQYPTDNNTNIIHNNNYNNYNQPPTTIVFYEPSNDSLYKVFGIMTAIFIAIPFGPFAYFAITCYPTRNIYIHILWTVATVLTIEGAIFIWLGYNLIGILESDGTTNCSDCSKSSTGLYVLGGIYIAFAIGGYCMSLKYLFTKENKNYVDDVPRMTVIA